MKDCLLKRENVAMIAKTGTRKTGRKQDAGTMN